MHSPTLVQRPPAAGARWNWPQRLCFALCTTPAAALLAAALAGTLGANPLEQLLHLSGRCGLLLLLSTLAISPLRQFSTAFAQRVHARFGRRLADWNVLVSVRRQLGLFAFFYAALHTALYLAFDVGFDLRAAVDDLDWRGHLLQGWLALLCLLPMAATSNARARKLLGAHWQRLHLLAYVAAFTAVLHQGLQAKLVAWWPWPETSVLAVLIVWRLREAIRGHGEPLREVSATRLRRWRGGPRPPN